MAARGRGHSIKNDWDPMRDDYNNSTYDLQYGDDINEIAALDQCRLYITSIPKALNESGLRAAFERYGTLQECFLSRDPLKRYAILKYETPSQAKLAMMKMNKTDPLKLNISIAYKNKTKEKKQNRQGERTYESFRDDNVSVISRGTKIRKGDISNDVGDDLSMDETILNEDLDSNLTLELESLNLEQLKLREEQLLCKRRMLMIKQGVKRQVPPQPSPHRKPSNSRCILPDGRIVVRNVSDCEHFNEAGRDDVSVVTVTGDSNEKTLYTCKMKTKRSCNCSDSYEPSTNIVCSEDRTDLTSTINKNITVRNDKLIENFNKKSDGISKINEVKQDVYVDSCECTDLKERSELTCEVAKTLDNNVTMPNKHVAETLINQLDVVSKKNEVKFDASKDSCECTDIIKKCELASKSNEDCNVANRNHTFDSLINQSDLISKKNEVNHDASEVLFERTDMKEKSDLTNEIIKDNKITSMNHAFDTLINHLDVISKKSELDVDASKDLCERTNMTEKSDLTNEMNKDGKITNRNHAVDTLNNHLDVISKKNKVNLDASKNLCECTDMKEKCELTSEISEDNKLINCKDTINTLFNQSDFISKEIEVKHLNESLCELSFSEFTNTGDDETIRLTQLRNEDYMDIVEDHLKLVIAQTGYPKEKMRLQQMQLFQKCITDIINMQVENGLLKKLPTFIDYYINRGAIVCICKDDETRDWIVRISPGLKERMANDLVFLKSEVKRMYFAVLQIPSTSLPATPQDAFELLQYFNPSLNTNLWKIYAQKVTDDAEYISFLIDRVSGEIIRGSSFKNVIDYDQMEFELSGFTEIYYEPLQSTLLKDLTSISSRMKLLKQIKSNDPIVTNISDISVGKEQNEITTDRDNESKYVENVEETNATEEKMENKPDSLQEHSLKKVIDIKSGDDTPIDVSVTNDHKEIATDSDDSNGSLATSETDSIIEVENERDLLQDKLKVLEKINSKDLMDRDVSDVSSKNGHEEIASDIYDNNDFLATVETFMSKEVGNEVASSQENNLQNFKDVEHNSDNKEFLWSDETTIYTNNNDEINQIDCEVYDSATSISDIVMLDNSLLTESRKYNNLIIRNSNIHDSSRGIVYNRRTNYLHVEDELKVALALEGYPQNKLDRAHTKLLKKMFKKHVFEDVKRQIFAELIFPKFQDVYLSNGAIIYVCHSIDTKEYLTDLLPKFISATGLKLVCRDLKSLIGYTRIIMRLPEKYAYVKSSDLFFEFQLQYPNLKYECWKFYSDVVGMQKREFGVDPDSLEIMENPNFKPEYEGEKLQFKIINRQKVDINFEDEVNYAKYEQLRKVVVKIMYNPIDSTVVKTSLRIIRMRHYSDLIADDLKLYIGPSNYPETRINEVLFHTITKTLENFVCECLESGDLDDGSIPKFHDIYFYDGVIFVISQDMTSRLWIEKNVPKVNSRLRLELKFTEYRGAVGIVRMKLFTNKGVEEVFEILQSRNPRLRTKFWRKISTVKDKSKLEVVLQIDKVSAEVIKSRSFDKKIEKSLIEFKLGRLQTLINHKSSLEEMTKAYAKKLEKKNKDKVVKKDGNTSDLRDKIAKELAKIKVQDITNNKYNSDCKIMEYDTLSLPSSVLVSGQSYIKTKLKIPLNILPEHEDDVNIIFDLLENKNPGLNMEIWQFYTDDTYPNDGNFVVYIDKQSVSKIQSKNFDPTIGGEVLQFSF